MRGNELPVAVAEYGYSLAGRGVTYHQYCGVDMNCPLLHLNSLDISGFQASVRSRALTFSPCFSLTVAEHLIAQHSAIKMLHSRVKLILEYVKASEAGETEL